MDWEKEIRIDLTCNICKDILTDPRILQCGHSFCKGCIEGIYKIAGKLDCSVCNQRTSLSGNAINELKTDFYRIGLLQKFGPFLIAKEEAGLPRVIEEIERAIIRVDGALSKLERNTETASNLLKTRVDEIVAAIETRERQLRADIEQRHQAKEEALCEQKRELEELLEKVRQTRVAPASGSWDPTPVTDDKVFFEAQVESLFQAITAWGSVLGETASSVRIARSPSSRIGFSKPNSGPLPSLARSSTSDDGNHSASSFLGLGTARITPTHDPHRTSGIADPTKLTCAITYAGHTDKICSICVGPESILFSGASDGNIRAWQIPSNISVPGTGAVQSTHAMAMVPAHQGGVLGMAMELKNSTSSPGGNLPRLISCGADATIRVWTITPHQNTQPKEAEEGNSNIINDQKQEEEEGEKEDHEIQLKCEHSLTGHADRVTCLASTPGFIFSGGGEGAIRVWSMQSMSCSSVLMGHKKGVTCLAINSTHLFSGSWDQSIKIWSLASMKCEKTLTGHSATVECLAVDPLGTLYSGSRDKTIRVWGGQGWKNRKKLEGHTGYVAGVVLTATHLISGSWDKTIRVWSLSTLKCEKTVIGHTEAVRGLAVFENHFFSVGDDRMVQVWNLK